MKDGFRQSMAWLHTWSGLLVCWILFLVFCGGTSAYYREAISLWMKPELHHAAAYAGTGPQAAELAVATLQQRAPNSRNWFITLPDAREPGLNITYNTKPPKDAPAKGRRRNFKSEMLDPASGQALPEVRETRGGEFLYRLHFDLHYMSALWARWIVGFCAMFMLVAIISGIITHKRIFKDLFTFRPGKGQRSWLDAHNFAAVLPLPFHLMITYTGLVTLMFMYMPAGVQAAYRGDQPAFNAEMFPSPGQNNKPAGTHAALAPVGPMVAAAERQWGGVGAGRVTVSFPNDANAVVSVSRNAGRELSSKQPTLHFNGASGALLAQDGPAAGGGATTHGVFVGLHIAHFAGPLLRGLFFLSGLAGCVMVASGALLWGVKTRQQQAKKLKAGGRRSVGLRLVDSLNLGTIGGLPVAFAVYFWANRLIEVGIKERPQSEIDTMFTAWAIAFVLALVWPSRAMWRCLLGTAALLLAALPILNPLTGGASLAVTLFQGGPAAVAGFDLVTLALGLLLGFAAWRMGKVPVAKAKAAPAKAAAQTSPAPSTVEEAA